MPSSSTALPWQEAVLQQPQLKLIAADMDGSLLDTQGHVPEDFWPLLARLNERGVQFVPASGRQLATLQKEFSSKDASAAPQVRSYIAENGNVVVHDGEIVFENQMDSNVITAVIARCRSAAHKQNFGLVVCGARQAYIERTDLAFVEEAAKYYAQLSTVNSLDSVSDSVVKLAIYVFDDAETAAEEVFGELGADQQVVVSGKHWIDIMSPAIDKGKGLARLQASLGVSASETAAFGDYLNDVELLETADYSFAMSNAHPEVKNVAHFIAPSNADHGVVKVIDALIGGEVREG